MKKIKSSLEPRIVTCTAADAEAARRWLGTYPAWASPELKSASRTPISDLEAARRCLGDPLPPVNCDAVVTPAPGSGTGLDSATAYRLAMKTVHTSLPDFPCWQPRLSVHDAAYYASEISSKSAMKTSELDTAVALRTLLTEYEYFAASGFLRVSRYYLKRYPCLAVARPDIQLALDALGVAVERYANLYHVQQNGIISKEFRRSLINRQYFINASVGISGFKQSSGGLDSLAKLGGPSSALSNEDFQIRARRYLGSSPTSAAAPSVVVSPAPRRPWYARALEGKHVNYFQPL